MTEAIAAGVSGHAVPGTRARRSSIPPLKIVVAKIQYNQSFINILILIGESLYSALGSQAPEPPRASARLQARDRNHGPGG
ncbi:MAG: hypothetical protein ACREEP_18695, partial [Dongiaceae bacterium]